jgi:hypothetical protein
MIWHTRLSLSHCGVAFHVIFEGFHLTSSEIYAYWQSPKVGNSLITHQMIVYKIWILIYHIDCWQKTGRFAWSTSFSACTLWILYGWQWRSLFKILFTLRSEMPSDTACRRAKRVGLLWAPSTLTTYSTVRTLFTLPIFLHCRARFHEVLIHVLIAWAEGTRSLRGILKWFQNTRCADT